LKLLKNYSFILRVILKENDCGSFLAEIPIASRKLSFSCTEDEKRRRDGNFSGDFDC